MDLGLGYASGIDHPLISVIHGVPLFRAVYGGFGTNYYFEVSKLKKTHTPRFKILC